MSRKLQFAALVFLIFTLGWAGSGCAHKPAVPQERFEYEQPQMGVRFRIVLYAPNKLIARLAAEAAFQRVSNLNQILSDYETDSELSELSRTAGQNRWVKVSPELWTMLERSQKLARETEGAFDVTVGPYVILWRRARRLKALPEPWRMTEARGAVGYEKLQLDPKTRSARLLAPGMKLDLGGIAKGYGVDEALKVLRARGITRALVAGSGDLAVSEPPPGKKGWRIEIAPLDVTNAPPKKFVLLKNRALATSGDLFQHLEIEGKRYSHIVDPRTGMGLTDHSLVTVIAKDCITADSLATAVSVLGPEHGLKLLKRYDAVAHIVRKPGDQIQSVESAGFGKYFEPNKPSQ